MFTVREGALPGLLTLHSVIHHDARGFFVEAYNARAFQEATGITPGFVQHNHSRSFQGVIRGLHYQVEKPQAKLVRVVSGEIYDVVVDVRRHSPTLGRWDARKLDAQEGVMLWVPEGYAHGFLALSGSADVEYLVTDYWYPEHERSILWNDPDLAIEWPVTASAILSEKDEHASRFRDAELIG